jgi:CheY-like chemotaxis protein
MEEQKTLANDVAAGEYNASDMPFDFVEEGAQTVLICEPDATIRGKIVAAMKSLGYLITEAANARDALKKNRFHVYDAVVLNERFDTDNPDANDLLVYFGALPMATRRQIFVILLTERFRSSDNMVAFNKSVNLIVNLTNVDDFAAIFKRGFAEHTAFYHVFKETLKKMGKI